MLSFDNVLHVFCHKLQNQLLVENKKIFRRFTVFNSEELCILETMGTVLRQLFREEGKEKA